MGFLRLPTLLMASLLAMTGCSIQTKQPAQLFQLDTGITHEPSRNEGIAVLLGPIGVAQYLLRPELLQRLPDGSLQPLSSARWAGQLQGDVDQLILRQLAARLDSNRLILAQDAKGFSPDLQLQVTIDRLDSGPEQPAILEAQWRLLDAKGSLLENRLVRLEENHQGNPPDQVRAQSELLQRLAGQMATAIAPLEARRASAANAVRPKVEPKPTVPKVEVNPHPQPPRVAPIRTDAEVYRF